MQAALPGAGRAGARLAGGYLAGLAATLFWGLSFVGTRVALEGLRPLGLVGLRLGLAALLLGGLAAARGGLLPERRDRPACLLLGLILAAHFALQTFAMQRTTAIRAGWIVAFMPAVVAVGAVLCLRERMRAVGWLGAGVASVGVLVLSSARPEDLAGAGRGDALMLISCLTWAAFTLISVPVVRRQGALRVTACVMAVAALPCLALGLGEGLWAAPPAPRAWVALVFLGVFSSAAAFLAYGRAVAILGAQRTASFLYVQPLVTLAGSWVVLREPFRLGGLAGGAIVLLGVWVIQRAKRGLA